ncbi:MAG: metal ABC transporter permease [Geminicoccaceae bacterium]
MEPVYRAVEGLVAAGYLPDLLANAFLVRGLLAALVVGPLLAAVGTVLVAKRLVFFTQTIGHASLAGVALGLILGEPLDATYGGLFGFCLIVALLLTFLRNRLRAAEDQITGVVLAQVLGIGIIAMVLVTQRFNIHQVEAALFGCLITLTDTDLILLLIVGPSVLIVLALIYNPLMRATINPVLARAWGGRPVLIDYAFILLATTAMVASLKLVGALLVLVLVVIPAATARNLSFRMAPFVWIAMLVGMLSAVGGLILSSLWPIPTGAAIVLAASMLFYGSVAARFAVARGS